MVKFSQLDSTAVASFLEALRARGVRRVLGPRGLRPLLDYLDSEGAPGSAVSGHTWTWIRGVSWGNESGVGSGRVSTGR